MLGTFPVQQNPGDSNHAIKQGIKSIIMAKAETILLLFPYYFNKNLGKSANFDTNKRVQQSFCIKD